MLQRIKSKKGFTLAELLIVVAIIAVLTAIAVPLFVSNINKAQDATFDANKQIVYEAAVVKILSAENGSGNTADELFGDNIVVYAVAKIEDGGKISGLEIKNGSNLDDAVGKFTDSTAKGLKKVTESYKEWQDNSGYILVEITELK